MTSPASFERHDALLHPFLRAADGMEAQACLDSLLADHATPIVKHILQSELHLHSTYDTHQSNHAPDLTNEALVRLLEHLRQMKAAPDDKQMPDFGGYVATTAYNVFYEHLRKLYPRRANLKNSLRHLLERHPAFALWQNEEHISLAGLAVWRDGAEEAATVHVMSSAALRRLPDDADELARIGLANFNLAAMPLTELLSMLFEWTGKPVKLNDLVAVVAELRGVKDHPNASIEEAREAKESQHVGQNVAETFERRELLHRAWTEIRQLTSRQRAAYLLNFKESQGHADITTFLYTRTTTFEQIAEALEMPIEELSELWGMLPLSDKEIARRLGVMPKKVTGLRKCAREKIKRRLGVTKMIALAAGMVISGGIPHV